MVTRRTLPHLVDQNVRFELTVDDHNFGEDCLDGQCLILSDYALKRVVLV